MLRLAAVAAVTLGCSTPYSMSHETTPLGDGVFVVQIDVNQMTSRGKAVAYLHRRAREVCGGDYELVDVVHDSQGIGRNKPSITGTVRCVSTHH